VPQLQLTTQFVFLQMVLLLDPIPLLLVMLLRLQAKTQLALGEVATLPPPHYIVKLLAGQQVLIDGVLLRLRHNAFLLLVTPSILFLKHL